MIKMNVVQALFVYFLTLCLFVFPSDGEAKSTTIKIATLAPEGSAYIELLNDLNADLKQKTNSEVRLRI